MRVNAVLNGFNPRREETLAELIGFSRRVGGFAEVFCVCPESFDLPIPIGRQARLLHCSSYIPEIVLDALERLCNNQDMYVFSSDKAGVELAVRLGARKNGSSLTGVWDIAFDGEIPAVRKRLYSAYAEARFAMKKPPFCIALAPGLPGEAGEPVSEMPPVIAGRIEETRGPILSRRVKPLPPQLGLGSARLLIAAGYGAGSKEGVQELAETARILDCEFGVSRPVWMNGWAPLDALLGVSGAMAHPELCIAAGVSGSQAFYAGIEKSGFIAAINTDKDAPIMKLADAALVGDCREAFRRLRRLYQEGEEL